MKLIFSCLDSTFWPRIFLDMCMEFFSRRGPFAKGFGAIKNHVYEKRNNQIENDIFLRLEKGT